MTIANMSLRQFVVAALALLRGAHAASSCCFVVQDEAHEIYWSEYATDTYTAVDNLTSITTLLTPYPTTTVTNYETNIYPINRVFTTTVLVTENPVSLYTNPAYAIPQKTEKLAGSAPMVTGGVTVNSPTGFWVYSTAKVFAAPAVTDSNGNIACGTLSSFSNVATTAAACVPTFTGINGNAAANFDSNAGQGVEISLTTPFIHIPTRAGLQISPSEVCVQGNGTENYGYPVQQLIDHLAGNAFYSSQYPGIENCIPAGPTIQAVEALAVAVTSSSVGADPPAASASPASADPSASVGAAGTTETAGGGLTSSTTITVNATGPTSSSTPSLVTSSAAAPGSTSTTSVTSTSVPTALPVSTPSISPTSTGGESAISGGLLPTSSSSTSTPVSSSSVTSLSVISPLMETTSPVSNSTSVAPVSTSSSNSTAISALSTSQSSSSSTAISSVLSSITSALSSSSSVIVPENSNLPGLTGSLTTISGSAFVIVPSATTIPLVVVGSTAAVSTATGLPPVTASSATKFVSWKLLFGITGLAAIRVW